MRKVEQAIINAIRKRRPFRGKRDLVEIRDCGMPIAHYYLHHSPLVWVYYKPHYRPHPSLAGNPLLIETEYAYFALNLPAVELFPTRLTMSRARAFGFNIYQHNFVVYIDGHELQDLDGRVPLPSVRDRQILTEGGK